MLQSVIQVPAHRLLQSQHGKLHLEKSVTVSILALNLNCMLQLFIRVLLRDQGNYFIAAYGQRRQLLLTKDNLLAKVGFEAKRERMRCASHVFFFFVGFMCAGTCESSHMRAHKSALTPLQ